MLTQKINDALNTQVQLEFFSAYSYLAMAGHFDNEDLFGFSHFFRIQGQEEVTHAMKIFDFIGKAGGKATLLSIDQPKASFASIQEAFELALQHEQRVTREINKLMDAAIAESDHATRVLLNWFVTEQLEEETLFNSYLKRVKMVAGDGRGILLLDQELERRAGEGADKEEE